LRTRATGTSTEPGGGRSTRRPPRPGSDGVDGAPLHAAVDAMLGRHGVRYTAHRRALVGAMSAAGQPLTIPELVAAASTVPQSSVYRNLALFEDAGLVHRMPGPGDFARYELAEELMGHHHHLVCSRCGAVQDVELPHDVELALDRALQQVARERGFALSSHRLDLVGDCTTCEVRSA
jgi:Fur family transcriptional regulator, ferric uptake regulator